MIRTSSPILCAPALIPSLSGALPTPSSRRQIRRQIIGRRQATMQQIVAASEIATIRRNAVKSRLTQHLTRKQTMPHRVLLRRQIRRQIRRQTEATNAVNFLLIFLSCLESLLRKKGRLRGSKPLGKARDWTPARRLAKPTGNLPVPKATTTVRSRRCGPNSSTIGSGCLVSAAQNSIGRPLGAIGCGNFHRKNQGS